MPSVILSLSESELFAKEASPVGFGCYDVFYYFYIEINDMNTSFFLNNLLILLKRRNRNAERGNVFA